MKLERAIDVLNNARDQARRMVLMYENEVIPKVTAELTSAHNQLEEHKEKIIEIDQLLASIKQ